MHNARFQRRNLYLLVFDELLSRVTGGVWSAGTMLPSEHALALELGVSIGTVRKALNELEARRLIEKRQGRGTFVIDQEVERICDRFCNFHNARGRRFAGVISPISLEVLVGSDEMCRKFRIAPGAQFTRVEQTREMDGRTFMYENVYLPNYLFPNLATIDDLPSNMSSLAQKYGIVLDRAVERVEVRSVPDEVARVLGVEPGIFTLFVERTVFDYAGKPVHLRSGYCNLSSDQAYEVNLNN